jgi:hypothetical protein
VLGLAVVAMPHELPGCEPAGDRESEWHDVRPVCVVREDDLREHDADRETDECTDDAGQDGHPLSEAPIGLIGKRADRVDRAPR